MESKMIFTANSPTPFPEGERYLGQLGPYWRAHFESLSEAQEALRARCPGSPGARDPRIWGEIPGLVGSGSLYPLS